MALGLVGPNGKPLPRSEAVKAGNAPIPVMAVERIERGTVDHGLGIGYVLHSPQGTQFLISADRRGLQLAGMTPIMLLEGGLELIRLLRRQIRQHEALKATPVGQPQKPLSEEDLDASERSDRTAAVFHARPDLPPPVALPHEKGV